MGIEELKKLEREPYKLWEKIRHKYEEEFREKYENEWLPMATKQYRENTRSYEISNTYEDEFGHEFQKYKPESPMSFERYFELPRCERCKRPYSGSYYFSMGLFVCNSCYYRKIPGDMLNWLVENLSTKKLKEFHNLISEKKWE